MSIRSDFVDGLIDQVERDRNPSEAHLAIIESSVTPQQYERYVRVLMDKLRQESYPSVDMLKRVSALVRRLPA